MFNSEDEANHLCKVCGSSENPHEWQICGACNSLRKIDNEELDETIEYEANSGLDNQEKESLLRENIESLEKINQSDKLKEVESLHQIESENSNNISTISEQNKSLQALQDKLYSSKKLYSVLTFTVMLFTFSAFTWFVYSELESQQISQYSTSLLVDRIGNKWLFDLKSKNKQLKQSISDKDKQIDELQKSIIEKNKQIGEKDKQTDELQKSIIEKNKQIGEKDKQIDELQKSITRKNKSI